MKTETFDISVMSVSNYFDIQVPTQTAIIPFLVTLISKSLQINILS